MVTQEILSYIRQERQKGSNDETIRAQMKKANWQEKDIDDAFVYLKNEGDMKQANQSTGNMKSLPGPITLLKEAWEMYKARWISYWGVILIMYGLFLLAGATVFLAFGVTGILAATFLRDNWIAIVGVGLVLFIPALLTVFYVSGWGQVALYHVIAFSDQKVRAWESFKKVKPSVVSFLWLGFLTSFIVMGGYFLFLIPGIIIAIWFSFGTFVFVVEGKKGMSALLTSREYVRGYWWAIFGRFFAIFVFWGIAALIGFTVAAFLNNTAEGLGSLITILFQFVLAVVSPVFIFYNYLLFKSLKEIKGEVSVNESSKAKFMLVGIGGIVLFVVVTFLLTVYSPLKLPNEVLQNQQEFDDDIDITNRDWPPVDL